MKNGRRSERDVHLAGLLDTGAILFDPRTRAIVARIGRKEILNKNRVYWCFTSKRMCRGLNVERSSLCVVMLWSLSSCSEEARGKRDFSTRLLP
jgi:hypothetical protein